jgi:autotransporter strand-loop-strand O-heptosyltransferase
LQQIASNILKIKYKEERCKLDFDKTKKSNFNKKYVCIATQSTAQCKYWNNKEGWNKVVGYLNSLGYDVVCIDKHYSYGAKGIMNIIPENTINKTGDLPLEDRINDLYHCEFFIGLGSGLSWLAWACEKPVIMISGFSDPKSEFYTPYRVHNKNVCNSCWSDVNCTFDRSDWLWCPRDKNFECSREITFDMVKEKIDLCIQDSSKK